MTAGTKRLLKSYCRYVYYAGAGNFWYQNIFPETGCYKIYSTVSFTVYFVMILLENLAFLFGDFPEVEKKSAMMFAAIHDIILIKMFLLLYHKSSIKKLNYEMATVMESIEEEKVMEKQHRKVKLGITFYIITVYLSLTAYGVESLRKTIVEGTPFYTVVTYLPHYQDDSVTASIFRVFFYMTWLYMMLPMISADCMPIIHLITIAYKFITLCQHYERIRRKFDENVLNMRNEAAAMVLKAGCLDGIRMHQKLMLKYLNYQKAKQAFSWISKKAAEERAKLAKKRA
ncbi:jg21685 [Pararge aegeria aegeria]|uniref:Jg21685 protein n=1 Tax=Pararge aegeria aegeria TaxID=348720 RepID=A0A8S4R6T0_9NEOP|nr:jg21685 [Pararge aegeria aegeria]